MYTLHLLEYVALGEATPELPNRQLNGNHLAGRGESHLTCC